MQYGISKATVRNWEKLNTQADGRLTSRANKSKSPKRILPLEYFRDNDNVTAVQQILDKIDEHKTDITSAILSLGIGLLKRAGLYEKRHVANVLKDYADTDIIPELVTADLPNNEYDILGLVYQSYLREGQKNSTGSYYTPQKTAENMIKNFDFSNGQTFFDPCCGSGSYLLAVPANNPNQIYGTDNDRTAVLTAKINLLLKYRSFEFIPKIYCLDFLAGNSVTQQHTIFEKKFDYIATNPPWGAADKYNSDTAEITSKETFSLFFVKAHNQLKGNGIIRFLFPESVLNVKTHKDIRKYIIDTAGLVSITKYEDMFSGVTTKYVDIECGNGADKEQFMFYSKGIGRMISVGTIYETENLNFNLLSDEDISIVQIVKGRGKYFLKNSIWALGIVTGDNKGKLFEEYHNGMEKIYTGKEIQPFILKPARYYILYDRNNLQQTAKEEIYRASEKLVYKFISNKLVFAYDDSSALFLNSANILIPNIPSVSIKAVLAFLNSELFQFMYMKLFGEVKILKGNLMELPFPEISEKENNTLTKLVNDILNGEETKKKDVEEYVFSIYGLAKEQIDYVRRTVNGKIDCIT